jgi:hypothetical protein
MVGRFGFVEWAGMGFAHRVMRNGIWKVRFGFAEWIMRG